MAINGCVEGMVYAHALIVFVKTVIDYSVIVEDTTL